MPTATLTSKGQITIPLALRTALGFCIRALDCISSGRMEVFGRFLCTVARRHLSRIGSRAAFPHPLA